MSDIRAFRRAFVGQRERTLNAQLLEWKSSEDQIAEKQQKALKNRSKHLRKRIPAYNAEVHKELYGTDLHSMNDDDEVCSVSVECAQLLFSLIFFVSFFIH